MAGLYYITTMFLVFSLSMAREHLAAVSSTFFANECYEGGVDVAKPPFFFVDKIYISGWCSGIE